MTNKGEVHGIMSPEEFLVKQLEELDGCNDIEWAHVRADTLLLEFINNEKVTKAYNKIKKWYA